MSVEIYALCFCITMVYAICLVVKLALYGFNKFAVVGWVALFAMLAWLFSEVQENVASFYL